MTPEVNPYHLVMHIKIAIFFAAYKKNMAAALRMVMCIISKSKVSLRYDNCVIFRNKIALTRGTCKLLNSATNSFARGNILTPDCRLSGASALC